MKPAKIFQQYIWLVNTLRQYKYLTLEEINDLWVKDKVIEGSPLTRASFYRHKDAIVSMFGIVIECDLDRGYKYFIANPEILDDESIERWMLSTLTVNTVLSDSANLRERILLENVPAGEEYLQTIIQAIKANHRLLITYQRFGNERYEKTVSPYALKLFHQRWYLLSHTGNHYATYALDRMQSVSLSDETFEMSSNFSPQEYFSEYFGVLTDETPLEHIIVRAYGRTPDYLRTLPLHTSQREVSQTDEYTDFAIDIRPTPDFISQLLNHADGLEVVEPASLRHKIREIIENTLKRYSTDY